LRIKKPSVEVKIQNLVNYSAVYCRNGKGPTILNIEYSVHFPLLLDIIHFYTCLPLNFEPATWVEYDLHVGKCTSKGVAACTPLMGWNILTLCKTFQQHIHVTYKSTHPSFPIHKLVSLPGNNVNFRVTPHIT